MKKMGKSKGSMRSSKPPSGLSTLKRRTLLGLLIVGAAGGAAAATGLLGGPTSRTQQTPGVGRAASQAAGEYQRVTLYKDPQCGCCEGYAEYLRRGGFEVSVVPTHDLPLLNDKYGIPTDLQPCHISLIGKYVVGGHVPIGIVDKLLAEKPRITGITLPGMPLGSPGMNGEKIAPFKIYAIGIHEIGSGAPKLYATV